MAALFSSVYSVRDDAFLGSLADYSITVLQYSSGDPVKMGARFDSWAWSLQEYASSPITPVVLRAPSYLGTFSCLYSPTFMTSML